MAGPARRPPGVPLGSLAAVAFIAWLVAASALAADDSEDDEASPYQSGIVAQYSGSDGVALARLDEEVAVTSGDLSPDRRIASRAWSARFTGRLQVQTSGSYRLRAYVAGALRLKLNGKLLIDAAPHAPEWLAAEAIELPFGYHPLEVEYRRTDEPALLALFWEGPQFWLEPLAGRWLYHETGQTPSDAFEQGQRLVRALRCAACHDLPGESPPLPAAAINGLAGNLSRAWLVDCLADQAGEQKDRTNARGRRRMPHMGFERGEAEAIADYLLATSEPLAPRKVAPAAIAPPEPTTKKKKDKPKDKATAELPPPPSPAAGATLMRSLGCLACHRVDHLGSDGLFGGGDLSHIAAKRPADFFARWLADPAALNRNHRMPTFALDANQLESLSLYLQTLGTAAGPGAFKTPAVNERGRKLVEQARCAACHVLPKSIADAQKGPLTRLDPAGLVRDSGNCLSEPDRRKHRPGYLMTSEERRAVTAFIGGISRVSGAASARTGHDLLVERNCLACHRRGNSPGLASQFPAIAEADPALRDALAALAPPALFGVGDKLRDDALSASITASTSRRRAWLRVQMPKFSLDADETRVLARHFIDSDRIPDRPADPRGDANVSQDHMATDAGVLAAGARLVTADGFGCTSCHAIGKWKPPSVALAAMGSDLSQIGGRIRHEWFDRWVRNPARIVPLMEMPAVVQPARGVLDGNLNAQLAAVWHVLDRPSFNPPNSSAMRVVRRANLPGIEEPAVVLTEVIDVDGRPFVKPLVIGLSNRHNVLVDLAHNRLAAWWIGDTARQQTRGKRWVWEAGVTGLLRIEKDADHLNASDMALVYSPRRIEPAADGDYVTQFDSFEHVAGGVRFAHRLGFRLEPKDEHPHTVRVKQQFSTLPPESGGAGAGFLRRVSFDAVPAGWQIELVALGGDVAVDPAGTTATLTGRGAALHVTLRSPTTARLTKSSRGAVVAMGNPAASSKEQAVACELEYRADVVADQFAPVAELDRSVPRAQLDVVPGFDAVRLPVTDQAMPTGLIWRADGTLVLSSLEGRVWLAHDTDGDGLEDKLVPFSDDLAAPFGVAAAGDSIDVINKYGLLRLTDRDGDGHADRTELLASGWGHTLDYHEWVVGLPRDRAGNYFVALACQQDERSEAGARMRGGVVKLAPREPTADDPRRFSLEQLCGGLRFPQGIALSPGDELFVTDNQGHYTPFNELNHVVPGARYGFINRLESQRGLNPPFQTAAIEIPHPWTRSVNGICFLETPAAAREKLGHELFGPLAGQMIGCEYDTRRLVRMSLERVAGEFQGAVYPLSIEPTAGGETFEGPLVCQISPGGDLYVGNIRDSGWGAGANTGSLVRLRWRGDLPCGIVEVRSQKNGFAISFTMAVDRRRAGQRDNYSVSSYRRIPTPDYGGPDRDRRVETVGSVAVSDDARQVAIELDDLREGFVYEFHVRDVGSGGLFFPAEAYYTLRHRVP